jgi:hypothetical protein
MPGFGARRLAAGPWRSGYLESSSTRPFGERGGSPSEAAPLAFS